MLPLEFTHFLAGVVVVGTMGVVLHGKLTHPIFYLWGMFTFMLPDLDHLAYWESSMVSKIFPVTWESLFYGLFVPRDPIILHFWGFPFAAIALALYGKFCGWRHWKYLAILAVGWATHLALDGVMLI